MSDEQNEADLLEAVKRELEHATGELMKVLRAQSHEQITDVLGPRAQAGWLQGGLPLLLALDRLTESQRDALLFGFELQEPRREILHGLLKVLTEKEPNEDAEGS